MTRWRLAPAALLACSGCVVIDAPETIEELVVFGFQNHTEGPAYREAFGDGLLPLLEERWEELVEGYKVDNLDASHLEAVGVDNPSTETIIGALGTAPYSHSLQDVVWGITYPEKDEVFDNFEEYEIVEDTDRDCFVAGECESYTQTVRQTVSVPLVSTAASTQSKDHRWVQGPDGTRYVIGRTLIPEPLVLGSTTLVAIHQQYDIFLLYDRAGVTTRVETVWIDATFLDSALPDDFLVGQAVRGMTSGAERIDELIEAER